MSHLVAAMGQIEMVLHRRMVDNKTRTIDHDEVTCQMGTAIAFSEYLMGLKEVVGEDRWIKGFTPAHQETKVVDVPVTGDNLGCLGYPGVTVEQLGSVLVRPLAELY